MRKSKITKKELAAVLRESVFAPNKPGPLKVIVDVGDSRYFMQRALELIVLGLQSPTAEQQRDYLGDAITLLGVAKHTINTEIKVIAPEKQDAKTLTGMKDSDPLNEKLIDAAFAKIKEGRTQMVGSVSEREIAAKAGDSRSDSRDILNRPVEE